MPNIFDSYLRGQQAAMNQGQNALAREEFIRKRREDEKLRNVLASAYKAPTAAYEMAGPAMPGQSMPTVPAQAGGMDRNKAIQALYAGGLPEKAMAIEAQLAAANAPMALERFKQQLRQEEQANMFKQFQGMMGGSMQPGTTAKITPKGPEMAFDPAAAARMALDTQRFQYETGGMPQGVPRGTPQMAPQGMPAGLPVAGQNAMLPPAMMANLPAKMQQELAKKQAESRISSGQKEVDMTNEARIKAKMKLPTAIMQLDQSNAFVTDLLNHPGLERSFGLIGATPSLPGGEAANFETMKNQLKNSVFITNRETLKGGGAITDYEGNKAEEAALRADRAQSPEAFKQALMDYQFWTQRAYSNLERAAQGDWSVDPNRKKGPDRSGTGQIDRSKAQSLVDKYAD